MEHSFLVWLFNLLLRYIAAVLKHYQPDAADWLLVRAARQPPIAERERHLEEWQAHVDTVVDPDGKILIAAWFYLSSWKYWLRDIRGRRRDELSPSELRSAAYDIDLILTVNGGGVIIVANAPIIQRVIQIQSTAKQAYLIVRDQEARVRSARLSAAAAAALRAGSSVAVVGLDEHTDDLVSVLLFKTPALRGKPQAMTRDEIKAKAEDIVNQTFMIEHIRKKD